MELASRTVTCVCNVLVQLKTDMPARFIGFFCLSMTSMLLWQLYRRHMRMRKTREGNKRRKAKSVENINSVRRRLAVSSSAIDVSIVRLPFVDLQAKLRNGELTCSKVLLAYQAKALEVHDRLNCLTGFILAAKDRALELDSLMPEQRGPLHGIPLSLKEVVGVKGEDSTVGFSHFIDDLFDEDATIVKVLLAQGAIPFVFTNIPQGMMSFTCHNPIYGETVNPVRPDRGCGGSSGGEAALLGGGGSILGIGCDIGGSNRVPAQFCGVCGFKQTAERISLHGNIPPTEGGLMLQDVYGPMARNVDALTVFMKATLDPLMFELDPLLPPLGWRNELYASKKPLRIGFYIHDGGLKPVPAVQRAVLVAKRTLEQMGHKVVPFSPPDVIRAVMDFKQSVLKSDDGELIDHILENEVMEPKLEFAFRASSFPFPLRWLVSKVCSMHPVEKSLMMAQSHGSICNWWKKTDEREAYRRRFTSLMKAQQLDALLCPAYPIPAFPTGNDAHAHAGITYTAIYNVLDFPSGVVPVTHVTAEDVNRMDSYPRNYSAELYVHDICQGSEGLPIAVQCVSFPFQEEVVLRMMKDLETGLVSNSGDAFIPDKSGCYEI